MVAFTFEQLSARLVFGAGRVAWIADETRQLGGRVMVVGAGAAGPIADVASADLGDAVKLRWNEVIQHVPVDLAARAREVRTAPGRRRSPSLRPTFPRWVLWSR